MYVVELLNSSGTKVAQLSDKECECSVVRVINKEWSITLTYHVPPYGPSKIEYFELWKCRARLLNLDDSTDYQTFVLQQPEFKKNINGSIDILCIGEHISIATMRNEIIGDEIDFQDATPTQVLTKILSYSSYSVGTVNPTSKISFKISYESVLSALTKLVEASNGEYTVNESTSAISILTELGSNNYVRIKSGKNIKSISKKILNYDVVNKMYGVGGGTPPATIAGARHGVYSVVSQVVTLDTNKVVPEDDSWNTYYAYVATGTLAGSSFAIADCVHGATRDTLTLTGTLTGLAAGDKITIRTSGGVDVPFIRAGVSIAAYGTFTDVYKATKYGTIINEVKTSDFDDTYTSGLCANWTATGSPTTTENTTADYIKYGSKSQKLELAADADGIYQTVSVVDGKYYTAFANVFIVSGVASFQITIDTKTYYVNNSNGDTGWQTIKFDGLYANGVSSVVVALKTLNSGVVGAAEYYVDSVAIIESVLNEGSVESRRFVKNCEQTELWIETFDQLMLKKDPQVEYRANFIDLYRIDPLNYFLDNISIGDSVILSDDDIGIENVSARVTEMRFNPFRPEITEHTITTAV